MRDEGWAPEGWAPECWSRGVLECWSRGVLECTECTDEINMERRNKNRGYLQLHVWGDAIELYRLTCGAVKGWPFEIKKSASQAIASADSVHRNIAEGYCRRSLNEYIQFLYIALASFGESVSGYDAFKAAEQINAASFETLDALAFKLENGLLKLIESLRTQTRARRLDRHSNCSRMQ